MAYSASQFESENYASAPRIGEATLNATLPSFDSPTPEPTPAPEPAKPHTEINWGGVAKGVGILSLAVIVTVVGLNVFESLGQTVVGNDIVKNLGGTIEHDLIPASEKLLETATQWGENALNYAKDGWKAVTDFTSGFYSTLFPSATPGATNVAANAASKLSTEASQAAVKGFGWLGAGITGSLVAAPAISAVSSLHLTDPVTTATAGADHGGIVDGISGLFADKPHAVDPNVLADKTPTHVPNAHPPHGHDLHDLLHEAQEAAELGHHAMHGAEHRAGAHGNHQTTDDVAELPDAPDNGWRNKVARTDRSSSFREALQADRANREERKPRESYVEMEADRAALDAALARG